MSRVFRNEGIDQKHNPEFTTIEAYRQYIDVQTWIQDSQDLLACIYIERIGWFIALCQHIHNSYEITYQGTPLSFKPPYPQLDILTELKKHIPELLDMNDGMFISPSIISLASMLPLLINHCKDHSIKLNPPFTQQRVLDELIHHYIECQCINPTFIVGHPMVSSDSMKNFLDYVTFGSWISLSSWHCRTIWIVCEWNGTDQCIYWAKQSICMFVSFPLWVS